jgi:hypothetical protein
MKIEISDEMADRLFESVLSDHLGGLSDQIGKLQRSFDTLTRVQMEDLVDSKSYYHALAKTYFYFTGKDYEAKDENS